MSELIVCNHLTKRYGQTEALRDVNLKVKSGKLIGLLGPNGSGKTTLLKLINGLLQPTDGEVLIKGTAPGVESKALISYLPDRMYFADWMKVQDLISFFADFYADFDRQKAESMCETLNISTKTPMKKLSKGNKEKVQLILVMSRKAQLYLLDEPIAGVDPAARDFILETILSNYNPEGTVLISTHLIADIEKILDEVIFIQNGSILLHQSVDDLREDHHQSIDQLFRDMFRAEIYKGGTLYVG